MADNKNRRSNSLETTKKLALSSLIAAGCFLLMYFASLTGVLDLCAAVLSSFVVVLAVIEIGGKYPWLIWLVSGTLCVLFIPDKFSALEFAFFGGIYPMIKAFLERFPGFISWTLKFTYFNIAFAGAYFLASYVFSSVEIGFTLKAAAFIFANLFFLMADVALSLMISLYMTRIRPRFKKGGKKKK